MIFSSFRFLVFFPVVLLLYYAHGNLRYRQVLLLLASYVFYGSWDPRFLSLLVISTVLDYVVGLLLPGARTLVRKRAWLATSVVINLAILGFFKYANFFIGSFQALLRGAGVETSPLVLSVILPVGISFYTFQTMSYSLDIYRGRMEPTRNLVEFALFVAFFPQLVAGPIVRAVELLPQLQRRIALRWEDLAAGSNRFIQGFAKKVLVADNVAPFVDRVFESPGNWDGPTLWVGSIGFLVQVYCDFSGYSDMAIGSARLLGFRLPENFRFPFTALNVPEFWRRWHITLYSFMRDYLYIALGGSRAAPGRVACNVLLTMTLVGLWHGANWQFVAWGFYNGCLIILYRLLLGPIQASTTLTRLLDSVPGLIFRAALSNVLFIIGLAIFRCPNIGDSLAAVWRMLAFDGAGASLISGSVLFWYGVILLGNVACEFDLLRRIAARTPLPLQWLAYALLIVVLVLFGAHDTKAFVYFQF